MGSSSRFDPLPPDKSSAGTGADMRAQTPQSANAEMAEAPLDIDLLAVIQQAERISKDYQSRTVDKPLQRAYRAWQNQHAEGSKYLGTAWRGRSRMFVPKTRSAVRKNLATAAASLFSTEDVVNVSAQFEDDPQQKATAAVIKADMDYRMTRSSSTSGMPWYQIAMGGCLDSQLTGVTISKQFWEYQEVETKKTQVVVVPLEDPETGEVIIDPQTGEPHLVEETRPVMRRVRDRPMIDLMPIENAGLDPAAPWHSPVQMGRWFIMRFPMGLSDARAMLRGNGKGGSDGAWLDVSDELLLKGRVEEDRSAARRVREGGGDRFEDSRAPGDLDVIWLQENFVRIDGVDYHFWSVGRHGFVSRVRETRDSYPEFDGERPYVMGVAQLDTHRVFPQSPVETWQPLQLELNDVANLRLDTLKRSIAPLAVVKRGKKVDLTQVQRRGQPDAVLLVDDPADVVFEATPGPTGSAYTETSVTNSMFDELAGVFSTSSVQSNRQLNETVGGMRLMSGAANAVSEFDLRMWIETWVEPALRQVMHLIRYWESDEKILAIAGQNARVWQNYQYMPTLDDFEQAELTIRVNAGIGALDPMQKLGKLKMAMEMLAPMMGMAKGAGITPNIEAIIEEVMGGAGFRDGRRFFKFGQPGQEGPPPEVQKIMEEMKLEREKLQLKIQEMQMAFRETMLELASEERRNTQDNQTLIQIEAMRGKREAGKQLLGLVSGREARAADRQNAMENRAHQSRMKEPQPPVDAGAAAAANPAAEQPDLAKQQRTARLGDLLAGRFGQNEPAAPAESADTAQNGDQMRQIMAKLDAMTQRATVAENALKALVEKMKAPVEVVRDPVSGRAMGVRKGGAFQQIVRGPDNRIAGLQPAA